MPLRTMWPLIGARPSARAHVRARSITLTALCLAAAACSSAPTPEPAPEPAVTPVQVLDERAEPATPADGMSAAFHEAFARNDARARAIVYWMQCVSTVMRLRSEGKFGPVARAPRATYCTRTAEGVPIGGVYDIDSAYTRVQRLTLVRLDGARPRYTDPVDTSAVATSALLARDVHRTVNRAWRAKGRPFSVVPVQLTEPEAWVIPRASKARSYVVGGDVGYVRRNGALEVLDDHTATWSQLTLPANGPLRLFSSVRDVAAVADLVTARWHAELGRSVSLSTPTVLSTLEAGFDPATGSRMVWRHAPVAR